MSKILHFRLDTIANDQVIDLSGNNHNGTIQGGVTVVNDDIFGTCLEFNGLDGAIAIEQAVNPMLTDHSFTIGVWVNLNDNSGDRTILGDISGNNNAELHLVVSEGLPNFFFNNDNNTAHNTTLNINKWYYLTWIYDKNTQTQLMYINGADQVEGTSSNPLAGASQLRIGTWGGGSFFNGKLHGLRIYDTPLSQSEIQSIIREDLDWSSFRTTHPIDFNLYDKDTQNVLYIEDTSDQLLTLEIKNASTQTIQLTDLTNGVSSSNYHFALRFRPGTLSTVTLEGVPDGMQLTTETASDWEMALVKKENDPSGLDVIYLRSKTTNLSMAPGDLQTLVFEKVGADAGQGARGTRVELLYQNIVFSNIPELEINANREINLSVINHRGKQNIPLHIGFVGDNGVLNDGATPNMLILRFSNTMVHDAANPDRDLLTFLHHTDETKRSKFILSFDGETATDAGPLAMGTDLNDITISQPTGWHITKESSGQSPEWILYPDTNIGDQVLYGRNSGDTEYFDLDISNIVSSFPTGHTHLHIQYENIPGYWDGQLKVTIEKRPLVFHDKNTGIGTVTPTEQLEVIGTVKSEALITKNIRSLPAVWEQKRKLQGENTTSWDNFGVSAAIDGEWAIIGAYEKQINSNENAGSAYLFHFVRGQWTAPQHIWASDVQGGAHFGRSVAISSRWAIVGTPRENIINDSNTYTNAGSVYPFHLGADGNWTAQDKIQAFDDLGNPDPETDANFGYAVAIDNHWAIVGALGEDTGGNEAGSAYLFHLENGKWVQKNKIQAFDDLGNPDPETDANFGYAVAIDNHWAIVGAPGEDTGGNEAGSAYLFRLENGSWIPYNKIQAFDDQEAPDPQANARFGHSVAINGHWAIVGAPGEDTGGSEAGSAYLFHLEDGSWTAHDKIQAFDDQENPDPQANDHFGHSVAINGHWAVVGVPDEDTGGSNAGSAYLFHLENENWTPQDKVQAFDDQGPDVAPGDHFGYSVAINNTRVLVGAYAEDTDGTSAGSAYSFCLESKGQLVLDGNTGNIGIDTTSPSEKLEVTGNIKTSGVIQADGTGDSYLQGNVGIGTTSPSEKLEVEGNIKTSGVIQADGTGDSYLQGNVGIGTTSPSEKLEVEGNIKTSGVIQADGIGDNYLQGNVGIGTPNPDAPLDVTGAIKWTGGVEGTILFGNTNESGDPDGDGFRIRYENDYFDPNHDALIFEKTDFNHSDPDGGIAFVNTGDDGTVEEALVIRGNGRIGIGTSNPTKASLEITTGVNNTNLSGGYFNDTVNAIGDLFGIEIDLQLSVHADHNIAAHGFFSHSDTRIKAIRGVSDNAKDLDILRQLQITDFQYIDTHANGSRYHKKVIGQQVAEVFPQAVITHTDVVPDIMQKTTIEQGVIMLEEVQLRKGEKVKLIFPGRRTELVEVLESNGENIRLTTDASGTVLVYGREVTDFHVVDYDALAMLNISATQELYKKLEFLTAENEKKALQIQELTQRLELLEIKNA